VLDIPEDPHGDSNANGYTNLEDWLYNLSTQEEVPVTGINVTGAGGVSIIDVDGGSLQMEAEVLPENATNKNVSWSVNNGSGEATITSGGLLTAVADGTVTVLATSADALVTGELVVTISNQDPTGISEKEDGPQILVYGNQVSIHLDQSDPLWKEGRLRVFALDGVEIINAELKHGHNQFNIESGPGIYILVMQFAEKTLSYEFFIE
jgi:uncharacterized protein YjdB